jgi:hypothetical protein
MHASLRSIFSLGPHRAPHTPVLVLLDSTASTDTLEIQEILKPWVAWDEVSGVRAIEDALAPGALDALAPAQCELVVLVSDRPEIARTVALECQRRDVALCRLELPEAEARAALVPLVDAA